MSDNGQGKSRQEAPFLENIVKSGLPGRDEIAQTSIEELIKAKAMQGQKASVQAQPLRRMPDTQDAQAGFRRQIQDAAGVQKDADYHAPVQRPQAPAVQYQQSSVQESPNIQRKQPPRQTPPVQQVNMTEGQYPQISSFKPRIANIKVIGIGGAGCNAIERMMDDSFNDVEFIAINTDSQALAQSRVKNKILVGEKITKGRGAGANPDIGKKAVEQNLDEVKKCVEGADLVFIAAGMGRGTGTGAAPIVADIAKKTGALTIAIVTKPFSFEGMTRMRAAKKGISELAGNVDTLITVPNDRLVSLSNKDISFLDAFGRVDDVLRSGVKGISDILVGSGVINVDFADIQSILLNGGHSQVSIGFAAGQDRALMAAQSAISSPLLETRSIDGAKAILFNITGDSTLSLYEVKTAADIIVNAADASARIVFGFVVDDTISDGSVYITLIATGLSSESLTADSEDDLDTMEQYMPQTVQVPASSSYAFADTQDDIPAVSRRRVQAPPPPPSYNDSEFGELPAILRRRK